MAKHDTQTLNVRAKVVGFFFYLAAIASIVGGISYFPIVNSGLYIIDGPTQYGWIVTGGIFELIIAVAAVGTSISLFPILRKQYPVFASGYLIFRSFEALLIVLGVIAMFLILSLRLSFLDGTVTVVESLTILETTFEHLYNVAFIIGVNFFLAINTFMYSTALYKGKFINTNLAAFGIFAAGSLMLAALIEMMNGFSRESVFAIILAIPIFVYEMSLATYLVRKGFAGPNKTPRL